MRGPRVQGKLRGLKIQGLWGAFGLGFGVSALVFGFRNAPAVSRVPFDRVHRLGCSQVLTGLKRARAIQNVERMLQRDSKACTPSAVAQFVKQGGLTK